MGSPKTRHTFFGGPYNKDESILGFYWGYPNFWETTISSQGTGDMKQQHAAAVAREAEEMPSHSPQAPQCPVVLILS